MTLELIMMQIHNPDKTYVSTPAIVGVISNDFIVSIYGIIFYTMLPG
ncbi:MAG: hypothetical protein ABJB40_09250 [Acidobacteriota bacterium]